MRTRKVIVIDYGIGNVFSVLQALERLGVSGSLSNDPSQILGADRVILPGVGAFGRAASSLRDTGLDSVIHDYVATGKPFLGICVGMQLLMETGEEFGANRGLGIIPGAVRKINASDENGAACRVPFIGWTSVVESRPSAWDDTPFSRNPDQNAFYFVHSFQADVTDSTHRIGVHKLGDAEITSAVRHDNVLGVQFHPERSAWTGQRFLRDFVHGPETS